MRINNFGGTSDSDASLDVAEKCAYLFDQNEYKIVIIFPRNGGGNPIIGYNRINKSLYFNKKFFKNKKR